MSCCRAFFAILTAGSIASAPVSAQLFYPPSSGSTIDQAAREAAAAAQAKADAAATPAGVNSAIAAATSGFVKSVNGNDPNPSGAVTIAIPSAPDLSPYATTSSLTAMQSTVMAAMPQPSILVPKSDAVGGVTGTAVAYMRADAQPNRITRAGACIISAPAGTCTITWATAFPGTVTAVNLVIEPINTTGSPIVCNSTTTQAQNVTSPAIRCWFARTLPSTLSLLGALVSYDVFGLTPTAITVEVIGVPVTQ